MSSGHPFSADRSGAETEPRSYGVRVRCSAVILMTHKTALTGFATALAPIPLEETCNSRVCDQKVHRTFCLHAWQESGVLPLHQRAMNRSVRV